MNDTQHPEDFRHHVRRYLFVFYALLFGTLITVGASYVPFGHQAVNIGVALLIACGEGAVRLLRAQREGKSAQEASEFVRGFPLAAGTVLA